MGLNEQCKIISFIVDEAFVSGITNWKKVTNKLVAYIFRFCRYYSVFSLANNSNLHRWKIFNNGLCSLCNKLQTQLHVFNNCKQALDRYTWRHDSVLFTINEHLKPKLANSFRIYVDPFFTPWISITKGTIFWKRTWYHPTTRKEITCYRTHIPSWNERTVISWVQIWSLKRT